MISRIIYILAVIDVVLITVFFFRLSKSSEVSLSYSRHIEFSFFVDYMIWVFFILLSMFLHYSRYCFAAEFEKTFGASFKYLSRKAMILFCDVMPMLMLIIFLVRFSRWLVLETGPGN